MKAKGTPEGADKGKPEGSLPSSARCSRLLAKLRGHGLIAKVKDQRLYRVTEHGQRLMAVALLCRNKEFPAAVSQTIAA